MAFSTPLPTKRNLQSRCNVRLGGLRGRGWVVVLATLLTVTPATSKPQIVTYRPVDGKGTSGGKFVVPSGAEANLTIFGTDLTNETIIKFTTNSESCDVGEEVDLFGGGTIEVADSDVNATSTFESIQRAYLTVQISVSSSTTVYFCVYESQTSPPEHQGSEPWLAVVIQPSLLPLAAEIFFIVILMMLSGLFSGLNLGLMSLDPTTLKIIQESGSKRQRIYAKLIYRVRRHGNYLLCTLLLGNVLVNSTLTILLDEVLPSGIYAVIASTLAIVLFGEIIPQAICSRHGLVVGAWTIPLTFFFMLLTFPLSMPLSLVLNLVLGKEIGSVYNRDQLLKLLHVTKDHHDLEKDEVDVISGVLGYKKKLAKDVMTKLEDVFCISADSVLDFKTMREIYNSGFSRIPVYEDGKANIVHLLYIRDLAFVDADDRTTLASHIQFYQHNLLFFFDDTPLDEILKGFLEGKCHLGVIQTIREVPDKDPEYVAVGVITLEDIVEEILQREIVDETDRFVDNRSFKPRASARTIDVGELVGSSTNSLTSQQRLVVYQFLSTEVEPFTSKFMTSSVLKRLLTQQNIVQKISYEEYKRKNLTLYSTGSSATFFCLVLEGCVEVEIGKDKLKFESRAFSYFGAQALMFARESHGPDYKADFTARPLTDCLLVIINQGQYMAARRASVFEEGKAGPWNPPDHGGGSSSTSGGKNDVFSTEWAKAEALDLSASRSKGSSSFFQLGFQSGKKSSDKLHLLAPDDDDDDGSGHSSSGRESPVDIKLEMGDRQDGTRGNAMYLLSRIPQARTQGGSDSAHQSSQV